MPRAQGEHGSPLRRIYALARRGGKAGALRKDAADSRLVKANRAVRRLDAESDLTRFDGVAFAQGPYFTTALGQDAGQQSTHLSNAAEDTRSPR